VRDRRQLSVSPRCNASPAARGHGGQALVETALVIPVLVVLALGVVLVGRVVYATIALDATVREAGRALAAAPSEAAGLAAGRERGRAVAVGYGLEADRLELTLDSGGFARGGTATARAQYRVPVVGLLLLGQADVTIRREHQERIDRYRSREGPGP
jgi:Flp pilus assembly protein TadG